MLPETIATDALNRGIICGHRPIACGRPGLPDLPGAAGTAPALCLSGVHHRYGRRAALTEVDLVLAPGEILCLLGPSGCGKSTLLRLAAGLEPLQAGTIAILGRPVAGPRTAVPPERRGVGLVFQDYALFPHLSVLDNVGFGLRRLSSAERRQQALAMLARVEMAEFAAAYPHQLSGGQQQRVALARALAPRPAVLLLDEPFSGLDSRLRRQVRDQTLAVLRDHGVACVMVTHDAEEAMAVADRIAVMLEGRIVQTGTPDDLYLRPVDGFVAAFLGDVNRIGGRMRAGAVETVLGRIPINAACTCCHGDGAAMEVLVRPEGMRIAPAGTTELGTVAVVEAVRLIGRCHEFRLRMPACGTRLVAHLAPGAPVVPPNPFLARLGPASLVSLALDLQQVFIFPERSAGTDPLPL